MNTNNVFEIRSLLQNSQSVLIALAQSNDEDVVAAGLALYMTLVKMRKQVTIVSAQKVKVELSHLFSIDKITDKITGGNNLVVSLPYQEGSIEKVSYHIENNRFNLVIEPRGEKLDFDPNQIEYNYGRGDYDAVFVLGANNLSSLGEIYDRHKNIFSQKPLINIDKSNNNTRFGRINIVENMPVSQLVAQLVKDLRLPLDQDAASNLYTGIISKYGSVTIDAVDPQALDVLSFLGRLKAQNLTNKSTPTNQQVSDQSQQRNQQGDIQVQSSDNQLGNVDHDVEDQTPEDWLKPKIFTTNKQGGN
ncbi:hypothetical protein A3A55_00820 [Candidatus Roizmanbacteria bacterium RIFCSPLOWO2_01_FULL_40_14]|uniref:Phosphoesterase RecJ domain protein n=3 Tax=Candidatus Roizmaniibacteriota TaxID=1752723 RepID=A0A0G0ZII3_9BACT|nr:MAG: hypothetical protein UT85_C0031G0004 [Candidatus Levybacteria bacterium GW2011_GWA2_40_16]KKR72511.1 MAG: hypothetical protein UU14_C0005G0079 [Candidatus Roizmanbacteria bacterium GW2011_GWB1_40_7]KKR94038.1 MAG: hypothetical protein UU41_C0014G0016 [Candidatus Roizmanbacteria bacterium GW2011_GWA1_41_13]KKS21846.1 MAG: hypothetical protein UU78_C0028G0001 [Candidatus Roizmanbacteria bacterium GW2011_GWC2_41_7]OGK50468.1 MAG: hypothetical protein A3A55_00820 [Candidatus Roizmanbacteria